jgi:hypothetical protein
MQRWLRLVLVWLIAVALPVQGMAGAAMAHCGQSHERMHAAQAGGHHHDAEGDAAAPHHHEVTTDAATPDQITDLGQYKCSSCASCCSAIALLASMPDVPTPALAPTVFATAVVGVDAFTSDGPDRPPRCDLA